MIQQAYKNVCLILWSCLTFFKLKITNIFKSRGWGLEKSELPWEQNFLYCCRCVFCRTISLPSFNGLHCKLAIIALFIYYWVECMTSSVISLAYFSHFSNLISLDLMWKVTNGKRHIYSCTEWMLCDAPRNSRNKNSIIVPLKELVFKSFKN